jgi:hypothetical protein
MTDTPLTPPTSPQSSLNAPDAEFVLPATIADNRPCIKCSYNLLGLPGTGNCPECGTSVERSLRGDLLRYASPEYVAKLHRGAFYVQAGIIASVLLIAASIAFAIAGSVAGGTLVTLVLGLVPAALSVFGWWLLSDADPGQLSSNKGELPRKLIRAAVVTNCVITLINVVVRILGSMGATPAASTGSMGTVHVLSLVIGVVGLVATLVQYFASMLYIAWIGPRLPSLRVVKRARTMLWLGPVLYTVGLLLFGLGPLIALVLYYKLLEWIRKDLRSIRAGGIAVTGLPT